MLGTHNLQDTKAWLCWLHRQGYQVHGGACKQGQDGRGLVCKVQVGRGLVCMVQVDDMWVCRLACKLGLVCGRQGGEGVGGRDSHHVQTLLPKRPGTSLLPVS